MTRPAGTAVIDFLNHNPLSRGAKNLRNAVIDGTFRARGKEHARSFAKTLPEAANQALCVSIAFNTPWAVDILTEAWRRFSTGMTLVVLDNSSRDAAREEIMEICRQRDVPYLGLPRNPEWSPNRSHGIALNWAYYNLIRQVRPDVFGFVDHDCFPVKPVDIVQRMAGKAVYGKGAVPTADAPWAPWAGFCFFRFPRVERLRLDFNPRIEFGLDTGGGNWKVLYGTLKAEEVLAARHHEFVLPITGASQECDVFDDAFLHLGRASYDSSFSKAEYRRLLSDHIWDTYLGGRSHRLVEP